MYVKYINKTTSWVDSLIGILLFNKYIIYFIIISDLFDSKTQNIFFVCLQ